MYTNSYKKELVELLMNYLEKITDTERAISVEEARSVPAVAEVIQKLLS